MLLLMLFLVLRKRRKVIVSTNQTEIREGLDRSTILKERRAKRKAQQKRFALEPLDPASARAHYREFLLAMAAHGDPLPRQSYETPDEYAQRLLTLLAALPQTADLSAPSARVLLEALTLAYTQERYGTQSLAPERQNALRQGVFALQQCFAHLDKQ
jgi:hypothetical protein